MKSKSVHEPESKFMAAAEVWEDAQQIADVLRRNWLQAESLVRLQIPLSSYLSALDNIGRKELMIPLKRVRKRSVASGRQISTNRKPN
jgi:hypothetical protein